MLQGQLVFAHLRKNSTNIQMNVARVRNLQAVVNTRAAEMKVVVLNFEGFFKESKGTAKLLRATENASKVVIGNSAVPVSLICVGLGLFEQFQGNWVVL